MSELTASKSLLEARIGQLFDEAHEQLGELSDVQTWAMAAVREYCLRPAGKRLRGRLAATIALQHGASENDALRLGAIMELMQGYLLIVDDVMDKSRQRRGLPTIHILYDRQFPSNDGGFTADMCAVTLGMVVQHIAAHNLSCFENPSDIAGLTRALHQPLVLTGLGQLEDMHATLNKSGHSELAIIRKYEQKSGYYTFAMPVRCGLSLAGVMQTQSERFANEFGRFAGVAYQLHDDDSGIYGQAEIGKDNLDDIREGKYTLLVHYALQKASEADKKYLRKILGEQDATTDDLQKIRDIFEKSGARKQTNAQLISAAEAAIGVAKAGAAAWGEETAELLLNMMIQLKKATL